MLCSFLYLSIIKYFIKGQTIHFLQRFYYFSGPQRINKSNCKGAIPRYLIQIYVVLIICLPLSYQVYLDLWRPRHSLYANLRRRKSIASTEPRFITLFILVTFCSHTYVYFCSKSSIFVLLCLFTFLVYLCFKQYHKIHFQRYI